jgi:hypothetical protein
LHTRTHRPPPCLPTRLKVTQHPKCRLRVTIIQRPVSQPASGDATAGNSSAAQGSDGGEDGGSKFQLNSLIMSHLPVVLDNRIAGAAGGMAEAG